MGKLKVYGEKWTNQKVLCPYCNTENTVSFYVQRKRTKLRGRIYDKEIETEVTCSNENCTGPDRKFIVRAKPSITKRYLIVEADKRLGDLETIKALIF